MSETVTVFASLEHYIHRGSLIAARIEVVEPAMCKGTFAAAIIRAWTFAKFSHLIISPPPSPSENQSQWKLLQKVRYIFFHLIIIFLVRLAKSVEKHSRKTGLSKIYFRFFFYNSLHVASVKRIVFSELYNSWDNLVDSFFYFYIGRSTYLWILQTLRILVLRPLRVR